jgi:hypothetical protein
VLAVFAATQLRAATLTVRHGDSTGSPVAGSMMCRGRTTVDDVATPPLRMRITWSGSGAL